MCKITSLNIERFRGINRLCVNDTKRVNVFLGQNNAGKSSLLEAVMIMMGAANPHLPVEMNLSRDYNRVTTDDLRMFFYGQDTARAMSMRADFEQEGSRSLTMRFTESEEKCAPLTDGSQTQIKEVASSYGWQYDYTDNDRQFQSTITFSPAHNEVVARSTESAPQRPLTAFIAPRYNFNDFIQHFNEIVTNREKGDVIEVLREVDRRIADVAVVGDKVMVDIGFPRMLPINMMGDGTRKMFTVLTAMYGVKGGILLIDEIDNGLYYSTMRTLWSSVVRVARKLDVQVFATTHSGDSLKALRDVTGAEDNDVRESLSVFTLRRREADVIDCYRYGFEDFNHVLANDVEIR